MKLAVREIIDFTKLRERKTLQSRARNFPCKNLKKVGKLRVCTKIMRTLSVFTISETKENHPHARNFHFKFTAC